MAQPATPLPAQSSAQVSDHASVRAPGHSPSSSPNSTPASAPAPRPVQVVQGGRLQQVSGLPSTTSVLAWLREQQHCSGTKEGCNEGDCGACTVLLAELDSAGTGLQVRPVNSCIQFLPTLDGRAVITVEDLGGQHPAQQTLVACHGSQCGFCTPGFVMSLAACHARHQAAQHAHGRADHPGQPPASAPAPLAPVAPPSRQQIADDLSGNLCRCTGYRPILDAGEQMFATPAQAAAPLLPPALHAATVAALQALRAAPPAPLHYADATPFHAPQTLADLAALRLARPQAQLLAGSTDIGLWVNKQFKPLGELIYLGRVAELQQISVADGQLRLGAGVSLQQAWAALASHWPALREMGLRFASRPVREAGTLGGNLANGSPIGDSAPVLMALGAQLLLRLGETQRVLALDAFYTGYMQNRLAEGELLQAILVPLPDGGAVAPPAAASTSRPATAATAATVAGTGGRPATRTTHLRAYKLSKRYDCDISALACGLWLQLEGDNISHARLAFGGVAATVARATRAEAALCGQPWTEATLASAQAALAQDFQALTDLRASASYRQRAMANLLRRFWLETRPAAPLAADQVSVWSAP